MKYITENGNYARCKICGAVIETKKKYRKSRKSPTGKTYSVQPYCPTCKKFRTYKTMTYVRKI